MITPSGHSIMLIANFLLETHDTKSFMNQYGIHVTALLPARLAGSLIASITIVGVNILFRENGFQIGTWAFFAINFSSSIDFFRLFGYLSVNDHEIKQMN